MGRWYEENVQFLRFQLLHRVTVRVFEPDAASLVDHEAEIRGPAVDDEAESSSFEVETSQHEI